MEIAGAQLSAKPQNPVPAGQACNRLNLQQAKVMDAVRSPGDITKRMVYKTKDGRDAVQYVFITLIEPSIRRTTWATVCSLGSTPES